MSLCTFLGKYILYLFNLLCLVSSFGILAVAFILNQRFYKWSDFLSIELNTTPKILAAVGFGLFLIAIVGLCGVLRDSSCLLTLFSVLLTMVLIGELVLSGIVYSLHSEIESSALTRMEDTIKTYNQTGHETSTEVWNVVQSDAECCGIYGPGDWENVTHSVKLPTSCCKQFPLNGSCTQSDSFKEGCYNKFKASVFDYNRLLMWSAIGFGSIQLLAVCLACCRKCSLHDEYETV